MAQILVIYYQYTNFSKTRNDGFVALIYLNVCLSSLTFVLKIVEGSVKRGVLAGSALSEESEMAYAEATAAIRLEMKKGNDDINREDRGGLITSNAQDDHRSNGLELANIYPTRAETSETNPMHRRLSVANAEGASESSSLLRLQSRMEDLERQMEVIMSENGRNNDGSSDPLRPTGGCMEENDNEDSLDSLDRQQTGGACV